MVPEDASLLGAGVPLAEDHFIRISADAFPPHATVADKLRRLLEGLPHDKRRRLLTAADTATTKQMPKHKQGKKVKPTPAPTATSAPTPKAATPAPPAPLPTAPLPKSKCTGQYESTIHDANTNHREISMLQAS
jgi:hypothetical protein